jgi:glycerol uptake facilitator-like aquaporin
VTAPLPRRLLAEGLATALLLATVVGSGVMAQRLSGGNIGVALLANALATAAMLPALIFIFGPISGAQMNPAVTLALAVRRSFPWRDVAPYALTQAAGGLIGVGLAHLMFGLEAVQVSSTVRAAQGQWISEAVATFGLVLLALTLARRGAPELPAAVGLYIGAAYWFTASTSFANPAVTFARMFTDTFAGIAPASAPGFMLGQIIGVALALGAVQLLEPND